MWALPDIHRLNKEAAEKATSTIDRAVNLIGEDGEAAVCDFCKEEATFGDAYFDIFSEDPKGTVFLYDRCRENYSDVPEGYFYCGQCERLMIENYTWELYTHSDGCDIYCLNCWRESYLQEESHWIDLAEPGRIEEVDFDELARSPHLLAVGQKCPDSLEHIGDSVCVDNSTGGRVLGSMYAEPSPDGAVREIRSLLQQARKEGHKKAILILDAGWQFAVDIGVYVPSESFVEEDVPEGFCPKCGESFMVHGDDGGCVED